MTLWDERLSILCCSANKALSSSCALFHFSIETSSRGGNWGSEKVSNWPIVAQLEWALIVSTGWMARVRGPSLRPELTQHGFTSQDLHLYHQALYGGGVNVRPTSGPLVSLCLASWWLLFSSFSGSTTQTLGRTSLGGSSIYLLYVLVCSCCVLYVLLYVLLFIYCTSVACLYLAICSVGRGPATHHNLLPKPGFLCPDSRGRGGGTHRKHKWSSSSTHLELRLIKSLSWKVKSLWIFKLKDGEFKSLTVHKGKEKPQPSPGSSFIPSLKSDVIFILKIRQICYIIKGKILLSFKSRTKDIKNTNLQQAALSCNPTETHWVAPCARHSDELPIIALGKAVLVCFFWSLKSSKENSYGSSTSKYVEYYKRPPSKTTVLEQGQW